MILYSNGCSYTWGGTLFELEHEPLDDDFLYGPLKKDPVKEKERLEIVYPYHLGKLLNASEVINESLASGSNARIVRKTLDYFNGLLLQGKDVRDHYVTIQWTDLSRTEFFHGTAWYQFTVNHIINEEGDTDWLERDHWHRTYYKSYDTDKRQLALFIEQVYCLGNFFENNNIPYLFFSHVPIINHFFYQTKIEHSFTESEVIKLIDRFNWYSGSCTKAAMNDSGIDQCSSDRSHPSALGHKQWAEKVYSYILQ